MTDGERSQRDVGAIVLAAGMSRRMGQPKMVLPWGETTIIGQVITTLGQAGLENVVVVTGGDHQLVEQALVSHPQRSIATWVYNPGYADGSMTRSLQVGLESLEPAVSAALIALGDQPQMSLLVIQAVLAGYLQELAPLVIPSYQMKRGHPWIVDRILWHDLLSLQPPATLRDFVRAHAHEICYVEVDSPTILQDLDTPADYQQMKPP